MGLASSRAGKSRTGAGRREGRARWYRAGAGCAVEIFVSVIAMIN